MDINQPTSGSPDDKPKLKMPVNVPKLAMPKAPKGGISLYFKNKLKEYSRVIKITKKPDLPEFKSIVKATGLGITIIGMIGFIITMIVQGFGLL